MSLYLCVHTLTNAHTRSCRKLSVSHSYNLLLFPQLLMGIPAVLCLKAFFSWPVSILGSHAVQVGTVRKLNSSQQGQMGSWKRNPRAFLPFWENNSQVHSTLSCDIPNRIELRLPRRAPVSFCPFTTSLLHLPTTTSWGHHINYRL